MDGETARATINGAFGLLGIIATAWFASRTSIVTAQIALKQLEVKERAERALKLLEENRETSGYDEDDDGRMHPRRRLRRIPRKRRYDVSDGSSDSGGDEEGR
jgi:hypothetical protein